jgi:hypothetical protein
VCVCVCVSCGDESVPTATQPKNRAGRDSPKKTMSGFTRPWQLRHLGIWSLNTISANDVLCVCDQFQSCLDSTPHSHVRSGEPTLDIAVLVLSAALDAVRSMERPEAESAQRVAI